MMATSGYLNRRRRSLAEVEATRENREARTAAERLAAIEEELLRLECFRDTNMTDSEWSRWRALSKERGVLSEELEKLS